MGTWTFRRRTFMQRRRQFLPHCMECRRGLAMSCLLYTSPSPVQRASVQACLDYCALTASCQGVEVDFNTNPVLCWPHTNAGDYVDSNYYWQPGTDSYRLLERCAGTTIPTTSTTTTAPPVLGSNLLQETNVTVTC